ncbi:hypothetical protein D3C78_1976250 [compost metagenome]
MAIPRRLNYLSVVGCSWNVASAFECEAAIDLQISKNHNGRNTKRIENRRKPHTDHYA